MIFLAKDKYEKLIRELNNVHENKVEDGDNTVSEIPETNTDADSITTDEKDSVKPGEDEAEQAFETYTKRGTEIETGTNGRTKQETEAGQPFVARPPIQFLQSIKKTKKLLKKSAIKNPKRKWKTFTSKSIHYLNLYNTFKHERKWT